MALPSSTPLTCQHGRAIAPCHSLSQVNAVNNESKQSFNIAKAYLDKLMDLKLGDETMSQLMRGLRARRTALELLSTLAKFIHELAEDGAIDEGRSFSEEVV